MQIDEDHTNDRHLKASRRAASLALLASGCPSTLAAAVDEYLERAVRIGADREYAMLALDARMRTMPVHLSFAKAFADVFPGLPN
jgi:predicted O-linked N-acetylglucosamine transferase (SPINDLY family)